MSMSVVAPDVALLDQLRVADGPVLIAAPYIKANSLKKLIAVLPDGVSELICITRWLPEDIASGVCDIEIFEQVRARSGGRLLVHPHLHAKYYRTNSHCLVGSANLTSRALGWVTPANVELLVRLPIDFPGLREWEKTLVGSGINATEELRDRLLIEAKRLRDAGLVQRIPEVEQGADIERPASVWIPACPVPDRLWTVYRGGAVDTMVTSALTAAESDLAAMAPPNGLSHALFNAYVSGILRQMPLMIEIDRLASAGLTDSQACDMLSSKQIAASGHDADQVWRVLKAWLVHFFPSTYRLETGQEVLVRGRVLPREV